jgi:hypothetical protein
MPAAILPRFIRATNAPHYLGMCKDVFASDAKPHLKAIRIGKRGVGYDRLDLDAFADDYKARNGLPEENQNGGLEWEPQEQRESPLKMTAPEPSTKSGAGIESSPGSGQSRKTKLKNGSEMRSPNGKPSGIVQEAMSLCSQAEQKSTLSNAKASHRQR